MKKIKTYILELLQKKQFRQFIRNKYYVTSFVFAIWVLFIDEYSIVSNLQNRTHLKEVKSQNDYYRKQIASDRQKLEEINAEQKDLEKYAREHFYLSKPDEDVFIVVED